MRGIFFCLKTLTFRYVKAAHGAPPSLFPVTASFTPAFSLHHPSFAGLMRVGMTRLRVLEGSLLPFSGLRRPLQGCRALRLTFVLFVLFLLAYSIPTYQRKKRWGNPDVGPTSIHANSALIFLGQYINGLQPKYLDPVFIRLINKSYYSPHFSPTTLPFLSLLLAASKREGSQSLAVK